MARPSPWRGPRCEPGWCAGVLLGSLLLGPAALPPAALPCPLTLTCSGIPALFLPSQARLKYSSTPASRLRPAAAEVTAEVGQMLAYVRIKQQASMTAFATQLSQITEALGGPGGEGGAKPAPAKPAVVEQPASPTAHLPQLQSGLKVGGGELCCLGAARATLLRSRAYPNRPAAPNVPTAALPTALRTPPHTLPCMRVASSPPQVTITVVGLDFGSYLTGSILTETIFSWPGVGRYILTANYDTYHEVAGALEGGRLAVWSVIRRVENDDGAWAATPTVTAWWLAEADDGGTVTQSGRTIPIEPITFVGEGDYVGLTAIVWLNPFIVNSQLWGVIFEGEPPPAPTESG